MSKELESYITLKPIAERFSRTANDISDDEIKYIIKEAMKDRINEAINFNELSNVVDEYILGHTDEISNAVKDSVIKRLELSSGYKF